MFHHTLHVGCDVVLVTHNGIIIYISILYTPLGEFLNLPVPGAV